MSQLWTDRYVPKKEEEFIGNSEIVAHAIEWAKAWQRAEKQPPLLLWGQTGSGKTALAYLVAGMFKWDVVELNSSDLRSKDAIEKIVGAASQNASFFGSRRLILLDEVDALTRNDRGGASAISAVLKEAANPVILTANDIYADKAISALRFVCKTFEFKKINYISMAVRLREILGIDKVQFDEEAVKELARNCAGDMRSALLDVQTLCLGGDITMDAVKLLGSREREQKVFTVMKAIFKSMSFDEVRTLRSATDLSSEMLFNWVDENIPRQYTSVPDIALAFDRLSRADIFNGRIMQRQYWGFLRYSSELSAEGVALAKEKPSGSFVMYQFPGLLSMLSRTSGARSLRKELGKKIGKKMHSSSHEIISRDLPYLRAISKKRENAVSLAAACDLDEKEIAFLLETSPDTKKVQSILEEATALRGKMARPKVLFGGLRESAGNDSGDSKLDRDEGAEDTLPKAKNPREKVGESDSKVTQTKLF